MEDVSCWRDYIFFACDIHQNVMITVMTNMNIDYTYFVVNTNTINVGMGAVNRTTCNQNNNITVRTST